MMYGVSWKRFVEDSKYKNVATLHFIREEENTFYVTAYDIDGAECGGYKLSDVGNRVVRCFCKLGDDLQHSTVSVIMFNIVCYYYYYYFL